MFRRGQLNAQTGDDKYNFLSENDASATVEPALEDEEDEDLPPVVTSNDDDDDLELLDELDEF